MNTQTLTRELGALVLSVLDGFSSVATTYRADLLTSTDVREGDSTHRYPTEREMALRALDDIIGKTADLRAALEGLIE